MSQAERPVQKNLLPQAGRGEEDGDLAVLEPARLAGVLAYHPHRPSTILEEAGLFDHQQGIGISST